MGRKINLGIQHIHQLLDSGEINIQDGDTQHTIECLEIKDWAQKERIKHIKEV